MREWWPLGVVAAGIVAVGAAWFTRWVTGRIEKDRTKLHEHATKLQLHEYRLDEHDEQLRDLRHPDRKETK